MAEDSCKPTISHWLKSEYGRCWPLRSTGYHLCMPLKSNCVVLRNIFIKNYLLELSITNTKIPVPKMFEFIKAVVELRLNERIFQEKERNPEPAAPNPHFSFNPNYFHYPTSHNNRLACKVHTQQVDTQSHKDWGSLVVDQGFSQEGQETSLTLLQIEMF